MNTKKGTTGYFSDSRAFFKFINNKKKSDGFIYVAFFLFFESAFDDRSFIP